ncbi:MAG TPA: glycosyltransferase family 87 protein [Blastocatellia bacterium]|nr:glycosyltransferase family 87 protein [Blastocatellia bacterium]
MEEEHKPREQAPFPTSNSPTAAARSGLSGRGNWQWRLLVLLAIAGVLVSGVGFTRMSGNDPTVYRNDFNVFYFASQEVIAGRTPYAQSLGAWTPYLYPPLLAEILTPIAMLPLPAAAYIWFLINVASLIAAAVMSGALSAKASVDDRPEVNDQTAAKRIALTAAAAGTFVVTRFVLDNLAMGQVNLLTTALSMAHVYFFVRHKRVASAAALALAVSIKLTPAILIFYHVARGRLKFAAACAALSATLVFVSFAPFGAKAGSAFETFVDRTVRNGQGYDLAFEGNQSLRGFEARARSETGDAARLPGSPFTLMASLVLLVIGIAASARRSVEEPAAAGLFLALAPLISPLSWKSHFVVMLLPAAILAREAVRSNGWRRITAVAATSIGLVLFNLTSPRLIGISAARWIEEHSLIMGAAILMFFAVAVLCLLSSQSARSDEV